MGPVSCHELAGSLRQQEIVRDPGDLLGFLLAEQVPPGRCLHAEVSLVLGRTDPGGVDTATVQPPESSVFRAKVDSVRILVPRNSFSHVSASQRFRRQIPAFTTAAHHPEAAASKASRRPTGWPPPPRWPGALQSSLVQAVQPSSPYRSIRRPFPREEGGCPRCCDLTASFPPSRIQSSPSRARLLLQRGAPFQGRAWWVQALRAHTRCRRSPCGVPCRQLR